MLWQETPVRQKGGSEEDDRKDEQQEPRTTQPGIGAGRGLGGGLHARRHLFWATAIRL